MLATTLALVLDARPPAAQPPPPHPVGPPRAKLEYPLAPVRPVADTLHGKVLVDPYRWLEDDESPEVQRWTGEENALTRKYLGTFPGRTPLASRLAKLYAAPTSTGPSVHGRCLFYSRRSGSQNQPLVYVRDGSVAPRVFIDPNTLSADGTVALDWMYPSSDGALVAYGTSPNGSEQSTLKVRRADTGADLAESIPNTARASVAWDPDGKGFLYTRHPRKGEVPDGEEVFHTQIYHHRLADDPARDSLMWDDGGRPIQEFRSVGVSSDHRFVFLRTSLDWAKNDLYFRPAGSWAPFRPLATGLDGTTDADAFGGQLYLRSDVGAPRYRILTADPEHPEQPGWKVLIPEQAGVIDSWCLVGGKLAVEIEEKAVSRLFLYGLDGVQGDEIKLPALGTVSDLTGDPEGHELYFVFTSFVYPPAVYRYDLSSRTLAPLEPSSALNAADFVARQDWVTSKDGTRVPIFLVQRRTLAIDGRRPTILSGYGGFNISETPEFRAMLIPWLEAGGVYAQACLRGGGEFGRSWHEAGRLANKQNVFDDFEAAAQWLVDRGITKPERLAAQGGSNGGLLVGAALTQKPELFGAVICQVPLLDMIRYHRFSIARYWVPEYGSSEDPDQFRFLLAYSPYQNVRDHQKYPATLFTTAESDSRVAPLHARKMAALLQARNGSDEPILIRIETKAGHGVGKPVAKRIEEGVDILTFLMLRFGMVPPG
jgi:prolyl oligopeptidase